MKRGGVSRVPWAKAAERNDPGGCLRAADSNATGRCVRCESSAEVYCRVPQNWHDREGRDYDDAWWSCTQAQQDSASFIASVGGTAGRADDRQHPQCSRRGGRRLHARAPSRGLRVPSVRPQEPDRAALRRRPGVRTVPKHRKAHLARRHVTRARVCARGATVSETLAVTHLSAATVSSVYIR